MPDGALRSSYEHCGQIVKTADALGYQNILLPSGWIEEMEQIGTTGFDASQWKVTRGIIGKSSIGGNGK